MTFKSCFSALVGMALLLPSCLPVVRQKAYFTSPLNGYSADYHPLPQLRDSARTAVYAQGAFLGGSANEEGTDQVSAFRMSVTAAHHGKVLQAYYGGNLTLGNYHMGKWDSGYNTAGFPLPPIIGRRTSPPLNADILNTYTGGKFFGAAGFHGGINGVIPTRGGEWRFLGLETTLHHEFGDYLAVRKKLPDTAATLIARSPFYGTIGLGSELISNTAHGEFGFRIAYGFVLGSPYAHPDTYDELSNRYLRYRYTTLSFHYTHERVTGYLQYLSAEKAGSFGIGLAYRLTRPRTPPKPASPRHINHYYMH